VPAENLAPFTTTPSGGEENGEYNQLKATIRARGCEELFMTVILASHTGKAVVQITAIERRTLSD
jgi:hypothetical protein